MKGRICHSGRYQLRTVGANNLDDVAIAGIGKLE
jgi:hypothetical protein